MNDERESPAATGANDDETAAAASATATEDGATAASGDKAEEYLRLAQRAQADLANFRRRVDQEREEQRTATRVEALMALLPVLDDFERAIEAIPQDARSQGWVQGILLIERNLRTVLERAGFERIEAKGKPFDPWQHEALMTDANSSEPDDTVVGVYRPGYKVGNRVIRPAQVTVARKGG